MYWTKNLTNASENLKKLPSDFSNHVWNIPKYMQIFYAAKLKCSSYGPLALKIERKFGAKNVLRTSRSSRRCYNFFESNLLLVCKFSGWIMLFHAVFCDPENVHNPGTPRKVPKKCSQFLIGIVPLNGL